MSEAGMENTTQQLHYQVDEPTTQGRMRPVPAAREPVTGRVPPVPAPGSPFEADTIVQPAPEPRQQARRGQTTIADEVVERVIQKVVDIAVAEVDGVHGLHAGVDRFFAGDPGAGDELTVPEGMGGAERAVAVRLADDQATINLAIEVDFGYAVHDVVDKVRNTVIGSAERLLGMTVAEVNVVVSDVSFPEAAPTAAAADATAADATAADDAAADDAAGKPESEAARRPGAGRRPRT